MRRNRALIIAALLGTYALLIAPSECHGDKQEFVLVHGSGHGGWSWYKVAAILRHSGFTVTPIDLLSAGRDHTSVESVKTVAEYSKPLTDHLQNVTSKVILVGHSLGGTSISYAMEQHPEKISKAIFVSAFMPSNNQSGMETVAPEILGGLITKGVLKINSANGPEALPVSVSLNSTYEMFRKYLYSECSDEDINLGMSLVVDAPYAAYSEKLTLTPQGYGSVSRYYISTGQDKIIPNSAQILMTKANPPLAVFHLDNGDHMSSFSYPEELTSLLYYIHLL
ncbi:hypothetical protein AXG93_4242s1060 [Marchantia polymorpha subsp. ruderalis]|nr:hypothetical protein AXG93_4242s1060 [Marchantia polymorpha subsp. ruderalis]